ncbi:hypothetical protein, partial [Streptomyces sp. SM9]
GGERADISALLPVLS